MNDFDDTPFCLTNGDPLLFHWVTGAHDMRNAPVIVKKSRKAHSCVLGCTIPIGSSYLKFELIGGVDGSFMDIGVCDIHYKNWAMKKFGDNIIEGIEMMETEEVAELLLVALEENNR